MSVSRHLATRFTLGNPRQVARLGVVLALVSIALCVAVMEISLSVVAGFERAVQRKVISFVSDIQVGPYLPELDDTIRPIPRFAPYRDQIPRIIPGVQAVSPYVQQPAILKSANSLEGIVLKGVDASWPGTGIRQALVQGAMPSFGTDSAALQIVLSRRTARNLEVAVGDRATLFFLDKQVRARRVTVAAIYDTGFQELDEVTVFCDLSLPQKMLGWDSTQVQGLEIHLGPEASMEAIATGAADLNPMLPPDIKARPVQELYRDIFDWLSLQHQNVFFVLVLMTVVAVVNLASAILILITERTRTIGLLRALGASTGRVRRIFLWQALYLVIAGAVAGNLLGLGLLALQDATGLVVLDAENYFVKAVPIAWVWDSFLLVNAGVIVLCTACMVVPTWVVAGIAPSRVLKF